MAWIIGIPKNITWTTEDWFWTDENDEVQADSVKIEISRNGGADWLPIVADTPNTGSYEWTVEEPATPDCLIRLSGVHNTEITHESAAFDIVAQVHTSTIITPLIGSCAPESTIQFTAVEYDQEANVMLVPAPLLWAVSGGGIIDGSGLFTAGSEEGGPFDVTATAGPVIGTASVSVAKLVALPRMSLAIDLAL